MGSTISRYIVPPALALGLLAGCTYQGPEMRGGVVGGDGSGRWQLRGDGSSAAPYYYVWVPNGSTTTPPRHPYP